MTTTTNLMELRKLAEELHPWAHTGMKQWFAANALHLNFGFSPENAAYIAAANPATVIELLDTIEAQAKQIEHWKAARESAMFAGEEMKKQIEALQADAERYRQKAFDLQHTLDTIKAHIQADCL